MARLSLCLFILFLAAHPARSQDLPPIERFIDSGSILALEIDTTAIDVDAARRWMLDSFRATGGFEQSEWKVLEDNFNNATAAVIPWLKQFHRSGGTRLYVVTSDELAKDWLGAAIAPAGPGADSHALASLLFSGSPNGPTSHPANASGGAHYPTPAEVLPGVGAVRGALGYIRNLKPVARPQLQAARAAMADAPLRLAIIPTEKLYADAKKMTSANSPIAAAISTAVGNAQWIALSVRPPPQGFARLIIQSKDAATANQTSQALGVLLAQLKPAITSAAGPEGAAAATDLTRLLTPTVQNDRLVLDLDQPHLDSLMRAFTPALHLARRAAQRTQALYQVRQLVLCCTMYSAENHGNWPDQPEQAAKFAGTNFANLMIDPRHPQVRPGFLYLKPPLPSAAPPATVGVFIEAAGDAADGVVVGYKDGHCAISLDAQEIESLRRRALDEQAPKL